MGSMQGLLDQSIQFIERHQEWAGLVVEELEEMVAVVAAAVLQLAVPQ